MSTEVPDGATQRHSRMMELLAFISLHERATTTQIQSHMMTTFGLKFKTTSDMIQELCTAGAIKEDGHGFWYLTKKQQEILKGMVAQAEKERQTNQLLKRIDSIKDLKARKKALDLYDKLLNLLPEDSSA
jgi:predicted transcriptional regulator